MGFVFCRTCDMSQVHTPLNFIGQKIFIWFYGAENFKCNTKKIFDPSCYSCPYSLIIINFYIAFLLFPNYQFIRDILFTCILIVYSLVTPSFFFGLLFVIRAIDFNVNFIWKKTFVGKFHIMICNNLWELLTGYSFFKF